MPNAHLLPCDGCGQFASPAHISRRLQRLEWASRFRPLRIQTLLLGGMTPRLDEEFLYNPISPLTGEARMILEAIQISQAGKSREAVLGEFQKLGLMLTHVLECPLDRNASPAESHIFIERHLPAAAVRIRRSLKPKRVLLLSGHLWHLAGQLHREDLGCPVLPATAGTFLSSSAPGDAEVKAFRAALGGANV